MVDPTPEAKRLIAKALGGGMIGAALANQVLDAMAEAGLRIIPADTFILDEAQEAPSAFPPIDWEADDVAARFVCPSCGHDLRTHGGSRSTHRGWCTETTTCPCGVRRWELGVTSADVSAFYAIPS